MRQLTRIALGFLILGIGAVALTTASGGYDIDIDGSTDVPDQTVDPPSINEIEISAYATVDPGEDIDVTATAPSPEFYLVKLEKISSSGIDRVAAERSEDEEETADVTFDTGELNDGLDPGTYLVTIEGGDPRATQAGHPVVVSKYDLSVSSPSSAPVDESFEITVELTDGDIESGHEIEVAIYNRDNDDQRFRKTATSDGKNTYTATFSPEDVSAGTDFEVVATALDEDGGPEDFPNALAVEPGGTVSLTPADDSGDEGGPGGPGGGGGGGGGEDESASENESDPTETPPDTEIPVPNVTAAADANITVTEAGAQAVINTTPIETIIWENTNASGEVTVATVENFADNTTLPPGNTRSRLFVAPPANLSATQATVTASFDRDQLITDAIRPDNITMLRHNSETNNWTVLDTTITQEDPQVALRATTPGFSYLAVGAVSDPDAEIGGAPDTVSLNETVELTATPSTVTHGRIVSYTWQVDDERRQNETTAVRFDQPGTYTPTLTVRTDAGKTDTATAIITVKNSSASETNSQPGGDMSSATTNNSDVTADAGADSDGDDMSDKQTQDSGDGSSMNDDGFGFGFGVLIAIVSLVAAVLLLSRE